MHVSRRVQQATQANRWRFGQVPLVLALVLTRTPNDTGIVELEEPMNKSDYAVIRMRLSLDGPAAPEKYGRNISGMNKSRLLDSGL